jgi:hypothetical protein
VFLVVRIQKFENLCFSGTMDTVYVSDSDYNQTLSLCFEIGKIFTQTHKFKALSEYFDMLSYNAHVTACDPDIHQTERPPWNIVSVYEDKVCV